MGIPLKREIVFYGNSFKEFYNEQKESVRKRIDWTLGLICDLPMIPEQYFKHLEETAGLYEIRVQAGGDIFRIFCCFDATRLVILLNGFQKKTQKTPRSQLTRAVRLRENYFNEKEKRNKT